MSNKRMNRKRFEKVKNDNAEIARINTYLKVAPILELTFDVLSYVLDYVIPADKGREFAETYLQAAKEGVITGMEVDIEAYMKERFGEKKVE